MFIEYTDIYHQTGIINTDKVVIFKVDHKMSDGSDGYALVAVYNGGDEILAHFDTKKEADKLLHNLLITLSSDDYDNNVRNIDDVGMTTTTTYTYTSI